MTGLQKTLDDLTDLYREWFYTLSKEDPLFWVSKHAKHYDTYLSRFSSTLSYVVHHDKQVWETAQRNERIAMIVLFDQIPRHIFRGTCEMYAYDTYAIHYAKQITYQLTPFEFMYVLMPYQHSEDIPTHRLGYKRLRRYRKTTRTGKRLMDTLKKAFQDHTEVLRRFHEYPKRRLDCGEQLHNLPSELQSYIQTSTHPYI